MSDFHPDVEFLGFQVSAGKSYSLSDLIAEDDVDIAVRPHITNVALGPNPKPGRHTVIAESKGSRAVVGTLEMGRCEQFQVDLVARDLTFSHTGKSEIHLTGYCTSSSPYMDGISDEDDDEESEDDDEVPTGVPLKKSQLMSSKVTYTLTPLGYTRLHLPMTHAVFSDQTPIFVFHVRQQSATCIHSTLAVCDYAHT